MLAWWLAAHGEEIAEGAHAAQEAAAHGGHAEQHIPELPNLIGVIHHAIGQTNPELADTIDNLVAAWGFMDPLGTPFTAF